MILDRKAPQDLVIRRGPSEDLVGRQFGRLTVLSYLGFSRSAWSSYWACRCACGRTVAVGKALRKSTRPTRSCGCLAADLAASQHWKGCGDLAHHHFQRIANRAKREGIEFDLTIGQMWELFQSQAGKCKISGLPIELGRYRPKARAHGTWPRLATASLDRIDSARGYVLGNIQWVHKDINKMKGSFAQARLIELCQAVAAQHPPYRPEAGI